MSDFSLAKDILIKGNLKKIEKGLTGIDFSDEAQSMTNLIYTRTKTGLDKDGTKFDGLSDSYKKQRKKNSKLSSTTRPSKSNQTLTGQMLDAFVVKIENQKHNSVIFSGGFDGNRDDGKQNKDIYGYNKDKGRDFLGLSPANLNNLRRLIRKKLLSIFK